MMILESVGIDTILTTIKNGVISVYEFFINLADFIIILIEFIPEPFRTILSVFIPIIIALFFYKVFVG